MGFARKKPRELPGPERPALRLLPDFAWEYRDRQDEYGAIQFHYASSWMNDMSVWEDVSEENERQERLRIRRERDRRRREEKKGRRNGQ